MLLKIYTACADVTAGDRVVCDDFAEYLLERTDFTITFGPRPSSSDILSEELAIAKHNHSCTDTLDLANQSLPCMTVAHDAGQRISMMAACLLDEGNYLGGLPGVLPQSFRMWQARLQMAYLQTSPHEGVESKVQRSVSY